MECITASNGGCGSKGSTGTFTSSWTGAAACSATGCSGSYCNSSNDVIVCASNCSIMSSAESSDSASVWAVSAACSWEGSGDGSVALERASSDDSYVSE